MIENFNFSIFNSKHLKIFKNLHSLNFKDNILEDYYINSQNLTLPNIISWIITFIGSILILSQSICFLAYQDKLLLKNLTCVTFMLLAFLLSTKKYNLNIYILHPVIECYFTSINSIFQTYLKETNLITLSLILKTIIISFMYLTFNKSFTKCLLQFSKVTILTVFFTIILTEWTFLNLLTLFAFNLLELLIIYLFEFISRKYFYFLVKLVKEKVSSNEVLDYLEASYFSILNFGKPTFIRMENFIKDLQTIPNDKKDHKYIDLILSQLHEINDKFESIQELDDFLTDSIKYKKFKMKNFLKLIKSNEQLTKEFSKFVSIGYVKLMDLDINIEKYYRVHLRIQLNNNNYKIEGIFHNATFDYNDKKKSINTLILKRNISDIQHPLILLQKVNKKFHKLVNNPLHPLNDQESNSHVDDYSHYQTLITKHIVEMVDGLAEEKESTQVDIRKIINECVDYFKIYARLNKSKSNLKIFSEVEGNIPKFIATNGSIKIVIISLLSNAINFTNNGEVKVGCKLISNINEDESKLLEIYVSDTGVGVDISNFILANRNIKVETKKSGLKLVEDLLEKCGSKLYYNSLKNKGSSFCFKIPIVVVLNASNKMLPKGNKMVNFEVVDNKSEKSKSLLNDLSDSENKTVKHDFVMLKPTIKGHISLDRSIYVDSDDDESDQEGEIIQDEKIVLKYDEQNNLKVFYRNKRSISKTSVNVYKSEIIPEHRTRKKSSTFNLNILRNRLAILNRSNLNISSNSICSLVSNENSILINNNLHLKNFNVLVIDDDPIYLKLTYDQIKSISKNFTNKNIVVYTAYDPIEGLSIIHKCLKERNELFKLVLIDENMPFMTGSSFVKMYYEFLNKNGFYHIPFVSISSESVRFDFEKTKYFDSFLTKPTKKNEIKSLIKKYYEFL